MRRTLLPLFVLAVASQCLAYISISTKTLPNGTVNQSYSSTIAASGGCTPYTWKVSSGSLPAGIKMKTSTDSKSVTLSGTPTKAATYVFSVTATGCGGRASTDSYTVVIQTSGGHLVDLSWSASSSTNVTGYNVYRSLDNKSWTKINSSLTAWTTYTDSTVVNGKTYYYAATAVDVSGDESAKSNIATAVIP
ncbi:MAG TPA: putative Ig domain-containing protein [Dongiaceae bacterium]|nr:putative Ig domain-containing protein [Dongiaceae bacterium]